MRVYNDTYRGWPVSPKQQQHPVRGSYLDPRTGGKYHHGVDVSVRDDQPEPGAPTGRSRRVFALEGGRVWKAIKPGGARKDGLVRVGHFGYGHVDPIVAEGDTVEPGQLLGWSMAGQWHVHLSEWVFPGGSIPKRVPVNPLSRDGKLFPYADTVPPSILGIEFKKPASPPWRSLAGSAVFPPAGASLDPTKLRGLVDVRARIEDQQSFQGWFSALPVLETAHHPARVRLTLTRQRDGKQVIDREVFSTVDRMRPQGVPFSHHFAPGTRQNRRAANAIAAGNGRGQLWFRLFAKRVGPPYWDTTRFENGAYTIAIDAWDLLGNHSTDDIDVVVKNP